MGITCMFGVAAVPAIICGHLGRAAIRRSEGALTGRAMATAGLTLGYTALIVAATLAVSGWLSTQRPAWRAAEQARHQTACLNNLRLIDAAKEAAALEGNLADSEEAPPEVVSAFMAGGLETLACPDGGTYTLNPIGQAPSCSRHGPGPER